MVRKLSSKYKGTAVYATRCRAAVPIKILIKIYVTENYHQNIRGQPSTFGGAVRLSL